MVGWKVALTWCTKPALRGVHTSHALLQRVWIVGITETFDSDDVFTINFIDGVKVSVMHVKHDTRGCSAESGK